MKSSKKKGRNSPFTYAEIQRQYKTKKSQRTYKQRYYFKEGKRISSEKLANSLSISEAELEYIVENYNDYELGLKDVQNEIKTELDLNDFDTYLEGYRDLNDYDVSEFVNLFCSIMFGYNSKPFLSSIDVIINTRLKFFYVDMEKKFDFVNHKFVRGESEFAIFDSE